MAAQLFGSEVMMEDGPNVDEAVENEATKPPNAWGGRKLFADVLSGDTWYVAESDSEDVAQAMREEDHDDETPEEENPRCPSILFMAMEKQRFRRKWRSALIVKVLGRTFPFPVLSKRLESL
ncbi:unnamed protein product [Linum tenue]|uniref:Uncharacterized protein n=1 Tax=Linum tenue TaxID=586396 RepID=A0AAV0LC15_9ROSI|nr:unnamed protein product [Linum tenue]